VSVDRLVEAAGTNVGAIVLEQIGELISGIVGL